MAPRAPVYMLALLPLLALPGALALRRLGRRLPTSNCLELNKRGFPLDSRGMLRKYKTKTAYFNNLREMGYAPENLTIVPRGAAELLGNGCLKDPEHEKLHVIFLGDNMERQSWEAFLRNGRREGGEEPPASALLEARGLSGADMPGVERSPSRVETEQGLLLVEKDAVTWSTGEATATYARWGCESTASVLERLKAYREEAENTKFVVWMGCAVQAIVDGHPAWISDREDMMSQLFREVRGVFEDKVTLIWSTPNYIDMDLMQAYPVKYDLNFYRRHKVEDEFVHVGPRDSAVAASNQVPVAPRAAVTSQYRGLQCNGLQHDAHGAQAPSEPDFVCPGFPVIEDLVLQGGLAAACAPERALGVCSSAPPTPEQELAAQAPEEQVP